MRATERVKALEMAATAISRLLVVIDCEGVPTAAEVAEWEAAAASGRRLFIVGPGLNWGWFPGKHDPKPWEPRE